GLDRAGVEHDRAHAAGGGACGDRVAEVARRGAAERVYPELGRLRGRDGDHAVLERVRGVGVVELQPDLAHADQLRESRRGDELPPYVFATVDQLKRDLRQEGRDVIDLGFGNPDIPSPAIAVSKLQEAAAKPANHRYSASRGITQLRLALAEHYERSFGVAL